MGNVNGNECNLETEVLTLRSFLVTNSREELYPNRGEKPVSAERGLNSAPSGLAIGFSPAVAPTSTLRVYPTHGMYQWGTQVSS